MIKKLGKYLRFLLVATGWTVLYAFIVKLIMWQFWQFDIFDTKYWGIISKFWNEGGVINTASEYLFLLALVLIIPLWYWGLRKVNKLSFVKIIFFPVFWYYDYQNRKYGSETAPRVVIKNIGTKVSKKQSPQQMMEEMIANRMPKAKEKKDLNSSKIRSNFEQKNLSFQKKVDSDGDN